MTNDPEALALGRFYAFLHRRAEYLRQREAGAASTDSEAHDTPTAHSTPAGKADAKGIIQDEQKQ